MQLEGFPFISSFAFDIYSCLSLFRNFVAGARVMVSEAARRCGRGLGGLYRLDTIINQEKGEFRGFYINGLPTDVLTLRPGVYIYNCSNM